MTASWLESAYAALFARLQAKVPDVKDWTRRFDDYLKTSTDQQPSAILVARGAASTNEVGRPSKWTLEAELQVWMRMRTSADRSSPDTQLLNIVAEVDAALRWDPRLDVAAGKYVGDTLHTTLGGLCHHAWIADVPFFEQGASGDEAEVILKIEMVGVSSQ